MSILVTIVPLAVTLIVLGLAAFHVIKSVIKGLKRSIGSLIAIILSAVTAGIINLFLCKPDSGIVSGIIGAIKGMLSSGAVKDILDVEELGDALAHYGAMLIAPLFFMILFILLNVIFGIVLGILVRVIPPYKRPNILVDRLGGAGVGLLCGILASLLICSPIVGTFDTISAVANIDMGEEDGGSNEQVSWLGDISESTPMVIFRNFGCNWVYGMLSSTDFEGEKVYLKQDITAIIDVVNSIDVLGEDMADYDETQIEAIEKVIGHVDNSALLEHVVAGVFSEASEKWIAGDTFAGIEKFSAGELFDPVIDSVLGTMATSDRTTISADLTTMKDVFAVLIENDLLSAGEDYQAILVKIGENDIVSELLMIINANSRMSHIADDITTLSIRALATTIGIPADSNVRYDALMDDIAQVLQNSRGMSNAERVESITPDVVASLSDYGVYVSGEAAESIAESMVSDLGDLGNVSADDVSEFFAVYTLGAGVPQSETRGNGYTFDLLGNEDDDFSVEFTSDGRIVINGKELKNYKASNLEGSAAYGMGKRGENIGDAAYLYSADSMKSTLITMEDIVSQMSKYADSEDVQKEAELIGEILVEAADVFGDVDLDDMNPEDMLDKMGGIMDKMSESSVFGGKAMENMLTAVLQSDTVTSATGLSHKEITDFANKLNGMVNDTDKSYSDVTTTVSGVIKTVNNATDSTMSNEQKAENIEELINNITPDTADLVADMITPSYVENMGVPTAQSASASDMITSLLHNMADYSENGDPSRIKAESDAVNQLMSVALNSADKSNKRMFSGDGDSKLGISAYDFVALMLDSEVISKTLEETVYGNGYVHNPLGLDSLGEADETDINAALARYASEHNGAEVRRGLVAVASLLNVNFE